MKIIYNYARRELPVGFVRLDYIESTGTQWIDTGVIPNANSKAIFDCAFMSIAQNGTRQGRYGGGERFSISIQDVGIFEFAIGQYNQISLSVYQQRHLFEIDAKNLQGKLDGVVKSTFTAITWTNQQTLYLFARNVDNEAGGMGDIKQYGVKIYDNDTLVRNFIPCYRYSDGIEGLYDTVGKQFYTNQGTGRFLRGKEIDSGNLLDLSKFVRGYPSNTAFENTTKRTFTENNYVVGLASNNYYSPTTVTDVYINEQTLSLYGRSGYGIAFVSNLKKNKKYKAYWNGNSVQGIYLMYYSTDGTFISSTNIGTSGANRVEFTTLSDFGYVLLAFIAITETTATFSNISLHEVN